MINTHSNSFGTGWTQTLHPHKPNMSDPAPSPSSASASAEDIDSVCLRALAAGDPSAFEGIVERWQNRLLNFFYRATGNQADAEDLAQETFVELYRAAHRYKEQGSFQAFVFTLARRRLIDNYRKRSRRPLEFVDPAANLMQSQSEVSDHRAEIEEAFHRAIADLSENHRNAILMRQQQELSYEEIAQALEASVSAVKTWIHRARAHLREALKEYA